MRTSFIQLLISHIEDLSKWYNNIKQIRAASHTLEDFNIKNDLNLEDTEKEWNDILNQIIELTIILEDAQKIEKRVEEIEVLKNNYASSKANDYLWDVKYKDLEFKHYPQYD